MELILIRHGLPEKVVKQDGTPADPPLSARGHEQARLMAQWLAEEPFDALYSSPMARARQTATPLAAVQDLDVVIVDGVAEYDRNADQYIPVEELKKIDYARWRRLMEGDVDAGFSDFAAGVIESLEKIVADNRGRRVAVTCHGGVINVWTAHVIGFEPRLFFNPDYTSINRYMASSGGSKTVITLNEANHLKQSGI